MSNPQQYCRDLVSNSGSNFYYSFLFVPAEKREALQAIYAFCREVDDVVDECKDKQIAQQKLVWWNSEIEQLFKGTPQHPICKALLPIVKQYHLPKICFEEILQGMAMDLQYEGYQTVEDLRVYCHCVASTVGMLVAAVLGYTNPSTMEYAKKLGISLQMINIIRDVGEDARRGRIYLPEEDLMLFGVKPREILDRQIAHQDRFKSLMEKYTKLARSYYDSALEALAPADRPAQRGGLIMAAIYSNILDEIERANYEVLNQKISLTPLRKLWIAWRTYNAERKLCKKLS